MNKQVEYNGKTYKSLNALCKELNLSGKTLSYRLSKGLSLDDAINGFTKTIWYNGKKYSSITKVAADYGVSYDAVFAGLRKGKTLEEAMKTTLAGKRRREENRIDVVYKNRKYENIGSLSKETGLSFSKIKNAIKHNIPIEEVLSNADVAITKPIIYEGKKYWNLAQLCSEKKISSTNLYRYLDQGLTIKEALDESIKVRSAVEYNGKTYKSLRELSRELGIPYSNLNYRKKIYPSMEEAVKNAFTVNKSKGCLSITYKGKAYRGASALSRELGISGESLRKKIRQGMSVDEAVESLLQKKTSLEA